MTLSPRQISDLLTAHGLRPNRALGQNFVTDANTVRRVVRLAEVGPGDRVIEIGPGLGSLTMALAETGAAITAVEVDQRLLPVLEAVVGPGVRLVHGDAMRLDWPEVLGPDPGWVMVANLPYNIATPLVADVLDGVPAIERMVVMVQREVGERLVARPGDPQYGAVSVKVAYWAEASVVGYVPPTVFLPRPKVDSALVSIRRHPAPAIDPATVDADTLFGLVKAGFGKRRKMLRRALAGTVPPGAFEAAGVRPDSRAENLDLQAWGRLAAATKAVRDPGDNGGEQAVEDDGAETRAGENDGAESKAGEDDGAETRAGEDEGAETTAGENDGAERTAGENDGADTTAVEDDEHE